MVCHEEWKLQMKAKTRSERAHGVREKGAQRPWVWGSMLGGHECRGFKPGPVCRAGSSFQVFIYSAPELGFELRSFILGLVLTGSLTHTLPRPWDTGTGVGTLSWDLVCLLLSACDLGHASLPL